MNKVELVNDFMSMIGRLEWNGEILNENSVLNEEDKIRIQEIKDEYDI